MDARNDPSYRVPAFVQAAQEEGRAPRKVTKLEPTHVWNVEILAAHRDYTTKLINRDLERLALATEWTDEAKEQQTAAKKILNTIVKQFPDATYVDVTIGGDVGGLHFAVRAHEPPSP